MQAHYDIIIVGAGPAGLSFARSMSGLAIKILVIDKSSGSTLSSPPDDGREIALTHDSVNIMKSLGVWKLITKENTSIIKEAKVYNGDSSNSLDFKTNNKSIEALGYIVSNRVIRETIYEEVCKCTNVEILSDRQVIEASSSAETASVTLDNGHKYFSKLLVAADSRFSETRKMMGIAAKSHDFSRTAIVCKMKHDLPHNNQATEYFQHGRTTAILPLQKNYSSIVLTVNNPKAKFFTELEDNQFCRNVEEHIQHGLGNMTLIGQRHSYPLVAVHAERFASHRFALIGDSAVGMHPVTAHGFNLGLLGQNTLSKELIRAFRHNLDLGSTSALKRYERKHMLSTRPLYHGTNIIVNLFTNDSRPAKIIRQTTLNFANHFHPIKHWVSRLLRDNSEHHLKNSNLSLKPPAILENMIRKFKL